MKKLHTLLLFVMMSGGAFTQGLEGIIVETYYISNANDATDTDGGSLAAGSTTYRIFVDMAPGYEIQAVYGNANHELRIATTTQFFNNVDRGELTGNAINDARVDENTVALDSWLSMGPATDAHFGVLKSEDTNGSIVGGANNDGGSANIPGGLLVNADPLAGIPLTTADGLIPGVVPNVTLVGINPTMFDNVNSSTTFTTNGGAWSVLEGVVGPTATNRVLIAQITTNGDLSFELNIQLGAPNGTVEKYVAENPINDEIFFGQLTFPFQSSGPGCTNPIACNYDANASEDDGSCIVPVPNCQACNSTNTGLVIVDADGDGICNANEVPGCTNMMACNFNPTATDNDGSCIVPVANCTACNATNTGLVLIDADGDGICNAQEVAGCTSSTACNYNASATDNNGSCVFPFPNCQACNGTNDGLVIIDADGDGICNAQEIPGCTDPEALNFNPAATDDNGTCSYEATPGCTNELACNYDPFATEDDGSCIVPVEGCTECNAGNDGLVLIDSDEDGICDAEEAEGCTDENACNYSMLATDDDGSCIIPVSGCTVCNGTNDGLVLIDTDDDGVCDGEEVSGCTNANACNYDSSATEDNGSCIVPVPNCQECNSTNDGLVLVDTDGDGICNANEIAGCLSPTACNFLPDATDIVPCIEPVEDCQVCNSTNTGLIIVDTDGDGVCDAEEIPGCTNPAATNYNPDATDDDGSCEFEPGAGCGGGLGLEGIIVERYYIADGNDAADQDGGSELAEGSVTYRVYADLAAGYELQAVYGNANHTLRIETSTYFYNNADRGEQTGNQLPANRLDENTVALDSYVAVGGASTAHWGILKSEDTDGSVVGGANNDGGSEGVAGGLLVNDDPLAGIPLTEADGLIAGTIPTVTVVGLDLSIFDNANGGPVFQTNGGAWSVLEGAQGPTASNRVLIAQLTTDGELEFELNIQIGTPEGGVERYVASDPVGNEIQCDQLIYPVLSLAGCTDPLATNFNPDATSDNGTCEYDFAICDCNQEEFSPATRFQVGDGTANNDGAGGQPDFDCWAWAYDCGDIAGLPSEDPFGVCGGNLPLENNCGIFVTNQSEPGIAVYPNPTSGAFTIVPTGLSGSATLRVTDYAGRLVAESNVVLSEGGRQSFDLQQLASGNYHMQLFTPNGVFHSNLIIQK
ncbi:MAG: T9SS type A sorting domain-containing protein [Flavobacteriales bacterium]